MKISLLSFIVYFILFFAALNSVGCNEDTKQNLIDIKNFDLDGSLNDKYIFRNEIKKEKESKKRYQKHPFE